MNEKLCNRCGGRILFSHKAEDNEGSWTLLDAIPVDPYTAPDAHAIRVLDDTKAYRLDHMRESLEMRAAAGQDDVGVAEDFPWHTIHHCRTAA